VCGRTSDTRDELTAQEARGARLRRAPRTNTEISVQLFSGPRTVGRHLREVFTKLGIRSRKELSDVLPTPWSWAAGGRGLPVHPLVPLVHWCTGLTTVATRSGGRWPCHRVEA
jgi:DNA-binding CsgD family transcriptional regulator